MMHNPASWVDSKMMSAQESGRGGRGQQRGGGRQPTVALTGDDFGNCEVVLIDNDSLLSKKKKSLRSSTRLGKATLASTKSIVSNHIIARGRASIATTSPSSRIVAEEEKNAAFILNASSSPATKQGDLKLQRSDHQQQQSRSKGKEELDDDDELRRRIQSQDELLSALRQERQRDDDNDAPLVACSPVLAVASYYCPPAPSLAETQEFLLEALREPKAPLLLEIEEQRQQPPSEVSQLPVKEEVLIVSPPPPPPRPQVLEPHYHDLSQEFIAWLASILCVAVVLQTGDCNLPTLLRLFCCQTPRVMKDDDDDEAESTTIKRNNNPILTYHCRTKKEEEYGALIVRHPATTQPWWYRKFHRN